MGTAQFRNMIKRERELILKLLAPDFPGKDELTLQIETAQVKVLDEDGCLEFLVHSEVDAKSVKYVVPTEAEYEDSDGITVHVLLHMSGKKVKELEFFREDNRRVRSWPALDSIRVIAPR